MNLLSVTTRLKEFLQLPQLLKTSRPSLSYSISVTVKKELQRKILTKFINFCWVSPTTLKQVISDHRCFSNERGFLLLFVVAGVFLTVLSNLLCFSGQEHILCHSCRCPRSCASGSLKQGDVFWGVWTCTTTPDIQLLCLVAVLPGYVMLTKLFHLLFSILCSQTASHLGQDLPFPALAQNILNACRKNDNQEENNPKKSKNSSPATQELGGETLRRGPGYSKFSYRQQLASLQC